MVRVCARCTGSQACGQRWSYGCVWVQESEGGRSRYYRRAWLHIGLHVGLFPFSARSWTLIRYGNSSSGGPIIARLLLGVGCMCPCYSRKEKKKRKCYVYNKEREKEKTT
jgi:hypothetical protein